MKFSGKHEIEVSRDIVWSKILDPEVLEKVTPGIKSLEELSEDRYKAISEVKIGPVRGTFEGDFSIEDKTENESCVLTLDQKSKMGNANATIEIKLTEVEGVGTQILYEGDVRMSGMLARMGQRIVGGVISTLAKQFFKALEEEIEKPDSEESMK